MTASEYLNQIRLIEAKIKMLQRDIAKLQTRARTEGITDAQREELQECQNRLNALIMEAAKRSEQIEETVDKAISDPREYLILRHRYWYGDPWYNISRELHLEISWIYKLHKRALKRLEPYIPDPCLYQTQDNEA